MPGQKLDVKALGRVLKYLLRYKGRIIAAFICLLVTSLSTVYAAGVLGRLIDDYIAPMAEAGRIDTQALLLYILQMALVFAAHVIANFLVNRILITVAQNILKDIRKDMFAKMQTLPIRYFDTNTHGDIMSHYTNDIDTLRQMLSTTLPNTVAALLTLISTFVSMLISSVWLTLFVVAFVVVTLMVTMRIAAASGKFFVKQQQRIGSLNGYVEEMINGQKVIKVFNHEPASIEGFNKENEALYDTARKANAFASLMGPVSNNMGHLQYVLLAVFGATLAIFGVTNISFGGVAVITLGTVITFLQLSRSFTQSINNVMQQSNAIV
ncbi:MAG: ABC transporter ATP-binding protein, partial [Lachnospiraceae bacterium]|nr:ABC transporter ATP-binding protein [Lachnospiraceae bacterium]